MSLFIHAAPVLRYTLDVRNRIGYYYEWLTGGSKECFVQCFDGSGDIDIREVILTGRSLVLYYLLSNEIKYDWEHLELKFKKFGITMEEGMEFDIKFGKLVMIKHLDPDFGHRLVFQQVSTFQD